MSKTYEAEQMLLCEKFRPLVNCGDYRGKLCAICGEAESEHKVDVRDAGEDAADRDCERMGL